MGKEIHMKIRSILGVLIMLACISFTAGMLIIMGGRPLIKGIEFMCILFLFTSILIIGISLLDL